NPGMPEMGQGRKQSLFSLCSRALATPDCAWPVVRHQMERVRERRASDWAEALAGRWMDPGDEPVPAGTALVHVRDRPQRWLLTAAQDNTAVHGAFWANLLAYAEHIGAEVKVAAFTYNKALFEDHASRTAVFDTRVQPYLVHDNEVLGPRSGEGL